MYLTLPSSKIFDLLHPTSCPCLYCLIGQMGEVEQAVEESVHPAEPNPDKWTRERHGHLSSQRIQVARDVRRAIAGRIWITAHHRGTRI